MSFVFFHAHSVDDLCLTCTALGPRILALDGRDIDLLHQRVLAVVDELKSSGMLAEHILIEIKQVVARANVPLEIRDALLEHMTVWCVDRYYAPPPARHAS